MTSIEKIDYANIGLMLISCVIAFVLPFELFLFSYAVLGPLHYLTEIGWLHKKGYYTSGKYDFLFLIVIGALITLGFFKASEWLQDISTNLIYVAFLSSLILVAIKDNTLKAVAIILVIFSTLFFSDAGFFELFFAIYLPTIIHVFVFTALFMVYGAMKSKSLSGILSVVALVAISSSFFLIPAAYSPIADSEYIQKSYGSFAELNRNLINLFGLGNLDTFSLENFQVNFNSIFGSLEGFMVMRFIAFAYTYHYLNWFSKTSVIQWHKVPKKSLMAIVGIWILSVALYLYKYEVGLKWLFLLSFLHVLLEFPLNYRSFIGIGQEAKKLFIGGGNGPIGQSTPSK
jgi:hypothetical protein